MQFSKSSTLSKEPISVNAMECRLPYRASDYQERVHWILCTSKQRGIDLKKVKLLEGQPVFLNTSLKTERESVRRQERTQESYRFLSCVKGISTDTSHIPTQPMHMTMTDR